LAQRELLFRFCRNRSLVGRNGHGVIVKTGGVPGRPDWRRIGLEDAADDNAVSEHVVVVVIPLARWATRS
jgi:hypothetical protein